LDITLDYSLILSIWTGSAVPIITTFLAYALIKRAENKRQTFAEKKRVYGELELAIGNYAQALTDFRSLQLLKPEKGDVKNMQVLFVKFWSLRSVWLGEGCMDVLRDMMYNEEDDEGPASPTKLKIAFEALKQRMTIELVHYVVATGTRMGRYNLQMQRFHLSQSITDSLAKVFQLIGQLSQNISSSSLLSMTEFSALDTGEDVGPFLKQMQDALAQLSKALADDLQVSQ
jgi:tetratricopeptide (TPR) repeat protein